MKLKRNRNYLVLGFAVFLAAGLIVLKVVDPYSNQWLPKCALFEWTGLHCPGCGITRALDALLDGQFLLAFWYNPLLFVGLPLVLVLVWRRRQKVSAGMSVNPIFCWVVFLVLVGYMLARNLPNPSEGWLAPPSRPEKVAGYWSTALVSMPSCELLNPVFKSTDD